MTMPITTRAASPSTIHSTAEFELPPVVTGWSGTVGAGASVLGATGTTSSGVVATGVVAGTVAGTDTTPRPPISTITAQASLTITVAPVAPVTWRAKITPREGSYPGGGIPKAPGRARIRERGGAWPVTRPRHTGHIRYGGTRPRSPEARAVP